MNEFSQKNINAFFRNTPGKKFIIYTLHRNAFSHLFIVVYASANEFKLSMQMCQPGSQALAQATQDRPRKVMQLQILRQRAHSHVLEHQHVASLTR